MKPAAFALLLSVSLLAAACVPAYANEQPDAQAVFSTPTVELATQPATVIPTRVVPDRTTPEVTPLPEQIFALPPELEVLMTQVAVFPHEECQPRWDTYLPSPNLAYLAQVCANGVMQIMNADGSDFREFKREDFFKNPEQTGDEGLIEPFIWSEDGNYLFFSVVEADKKPWFADGTALYRLTMDKNRLTGYLGNALSSSSWYSYGLSPDGRTIAYIDQGRKPLQLVLMRVGSGEDKENYVINRESSRRMRDYTHAGNILWSADGNWIAMALGSEGESQPGQTAIAILDLIEGKTRILTEGTRYLELQAWPESERLLVVDGITNEKLWLSIRTGTLSPVPQE